MTLATEKSEVKMKCNSLYLCTLYTSFLPPQVLFGQIVVKTVVPIKLNGLTFATLVIVLPNVKLLREKPYIGVVSLWR